MAKNVGGYVDISGKDQNNAFSETLNSMHSWEQINEDFLSKELEIRKKNLEEEFALREAYEKKAQIAERDRKLAVEKEVNAFMIKNGRLANEADKDYKIKLETEKIKAELKARGELDKKQLAAEEERIKKKYEDKFKRDQKYYKKLSDYLEKEREKEDKKKELKERQYKSQKKVGDLASSIKSGQLFGEGGVISSFKEIIKDPTVSGGQKFAEIMSSLSDIATQFDSKIDEIASNKSAIDTRLQGSTINKTNWTGSYWDVMSADINGIAAISPLVKQSDIVKNLNSMISSGISFNVEQRAFLATISEKIANTFKANDNTLLRLIRIQEADTTAARLGMESAMTAFLNNMYETTEYLSSVAESVRGDLKEAEALMSATEAVDFEYQVQKWVGSLYSVGFESTNAISQALGKLASGDISGLTGSGTGNLMVMAANSAGLSIGEILAEGLDDSNTNKLMKAMVEYLGGIYAETKDNKVVQQQMAGVFGLKASDLKAAANLYGDLGTISDTNVNYGGAMKRLSDMANSMYSRTSIGEIMANTLDNFKYSLAANVANSPAFYATYKLGGLLDSLTGGQSVSSGFVAGTGVNIASTIADMMKVGALGGSIIKGVANIMSAGGNGGLTGAGLLTAAGISGNNLTTLSRGGSPSGLTTSNMTTSESVYITNNNSADMKSKLLSDETADANKAISAAKEQETVDISTVNSSVVQIYELLNDVVSGTKAFYIANDSQFALRV